MSEQSNSKLLDPFLKPRAVAIIGLSRAALGSPVSVLTTLNDFGYDGRIFVVNPNMSSAPGASVCAAIADIPETVDLAIISIERARVPQALEECASAGIRAAIVVTQGFADADEIGKELQENIIEISERTGLRIIGPNTIGVVNSLAHFTSSFIEVSEDGTPVGQIAQSGFLMMGHHLVTNERAGFCMSVDLGNACDISLIDVLEYYEQEENVRVIECHVEAIDDGPAFLETAKRITSMKPLVLLKAGNSESGQAAVASHTGAVAGQSKVYDAAFRQAGVIQAKNAEELRLFSKSFATYGEARGRRVAIMSFSGGGAVLAIDALDRAGLELAILSDTTISALADLFPDWMAVHNPLDIWIPVSKDLGSSFPRALKALLADDGVDAVICIYCSYNQPKYDRYDATVHIRNIANTHPNKPVMCWSYGQDIEGATKQIESDGSAIVFPTLDSLARTLSVLATHGEHRRARPIADGVNDLKIDVHRAQAILAAARDEEKTYLFTEALEILDIYGLPMPKWQLVRDESELAERSDALSAPICLKVDSPDVIHKSDSGGVMLGIGKGAELFDAYFAMRRNVLENVPGANLTSIVLQEMAPNGVEILVGMTRDATFGPCIVFGAGGVYAEILDDFAFRIAPICEADAYAMIRETVVSKILDGARGRPPANIAAIVDVLVRISQLACNHPEIQEIDLNPIFAGTSGASVIDARFLLSFAGRNDALEMSRSEQASQRSACEV